MATLAEQLRKEASSNLLNDLPWLGRHGDETEWTHYANIQLYDGDVWELNEQFKGKNEDEMWIYGYYKSFGSAVRNLATKGTKDRKPIKIWM